MFWRYGPKRLLFELASRKSRTLGPTWSFNLLKAHLKVSQPRCTVPQRTLKCWPAGRETRPRPHRSACLQPRRQLACRPNGWQGRWGACGKHHLSPKARHAAFVNLLSTANGNRKREREKERKKERKKERRKGKKRRKERKKKEGKNERKNTQTRPKKHRKEREPHAHIERMRARNNGRNKQSPRFNGWLWGRWWTFPPSSSPSSWWSCRSRGPHIPCATQSGARK